MTTLVSKVGAGTLKAASVAAVALIFGGLAPLCVAAWGAQAIPRRGD
jgi:tetrahydromethanopterin S-methyltransferase subunit C